MAYPAMHAKTLRWSTLFLIVAFVLTLAPPPAATAQTDKIYFAETGHFLGGAFRFFWETNGDRRVFGLPITEEYTSPRTGRLVQYFERARFELTERNGEAYVELGLLGIEVTGDRVFPKVPPIENTADRRYIPETSHIIQYGFKTIWETYGDVRTFGYPISEEIEEQFADGTWRTVQYFERARFEYWPERADGDRVLISNLGWVLVPPERTAPLAPEGTPETPEPPAPEPFMPVSENAVVVPEIGPPGTTFLFSAVGFEPNERVGIWLTTPDQSTFDAEFQARADDDGSIADEGIGIVTNEDFPEGIWSFNARGVESGHEARGFFRIQR